MSINLWQQLMNAWGTCAFHHIIIVTAQAIKGGLGMESARPLSLFRSVQLQSDVAEKGPGVPLLKSTTQR